jgi:hypothetical protein
MYLFGSGLRPVKSAPTLAAPMFREGVLKVFRNTLTNDLRFYCRVDRESETYWSTAAPPPISQGKPI